MDTSAAIPLVAMGHADHESVADALGGRRRGLAGHAAFETYSVLTRLPDPDRRTAAAAGRLVAANFPHTRFLAPDRAAALLDELGRLGIVGGSVYDAMIGQVAAEHGVPLATRDRRAVDTYRALGVEVELLRS